MVRDASRSHQVVVAELGDQDGVVLKRARKPTDASQGTPDRERGVYELAASSAALGAAIPRAVGLLEADQPLVLERIIGEPFFVVLADQARREQACESLGSRLAGVHAIQHDTLGDIFPRRIPWAVDLGRHGRVPFGHTHPAVQQLIDDFTRRPGVGDAMTRAAGLWDCSCLIHGDLKPDNCLVQDDGSTVILDWELADAGDPTWDLAGVLQSMLTSGQIDWPVALGHHWAGSQPRNWWNGGAREVAAVFGRSYFAASPAADKVALIERLANAIAAWTLQTAAQCTSWSSATESPVPELVAMAEHMYVAPEHVAENILGLTE